MPSLDGLPPESLQPCRLDGVEISYGRASIGGAGAASGRVQGATKGVTATLAPQRRASSGPINRVLRPFQTDFIMKTFSIAAALLVVSFSAMPTTPSTNTRKS